MVDIKFKRILFICVCFLVRTKNDPLRDFDYRNFNPNPFQAIYSKLICYGQNTS